MLELLNLPPLASKHGSDVDYFILYVHWLMGALFVGWLLYFVYVLFRFRKSRNPVANYVGVRTHASSYIEAAVVICEAVLLIGFAIPLWAKAVDRFPQEEESTVIRVVAEQFLWSAVYPGKDGVFGRRDPKFVGPQNPLGIDASDPAAKDDVASPVNEIVVPMGKPVIAHITSKDVIHSFKVNPLRVTQDAIPGMSIPVWFEATREGQYMINCAQLCGNSHYFMKGYLRVVSPEEYEKWLAANTRSGGVQDSGSFE